MNAKEKYFKKLNDIKISNFDNQEKIKNQIKILSMLRQQALPQYLYRFRTIDPQGYNISAFLNDEIWGSTANFFNDPLDTQMFFLPNKVKKEYLELCKEIREIEFEMLTTGKFLNGTVMPNKIQELISNRKRIASDNELRLLIESSYSDVLTDIKTQSYIACFSEKIYSSLMWSHYANSHKGFAIEYRALDLFPEVIPVQYSRERVDATDLVLYFLSYKLSSEYGIHLELKDILLPMKILSTKSIDWKYENEWRIFNQDPPILDFEKDYKGGHQIILKKSPSAVYLGYRIERKDEDIIRSIAKEKKLNVYKMRYNTTDLVSGGIFSEQIQNL